MSIFPRRGWGWPIFQSVDWLKIDWQMSHKVTRYYINNEYWRKLVYKLKKNKLVIAQEMKLRDVRNFYNLW